MAHPTRTLPFLAALGLLLGGSIGCDRDQESAAPGDTPPPEGPPSDAVVVLVDPPATAPEGMKLAMQVSGDPPLGDPEPLVGPLATALTKAADCGPVRTGPLGAHRVRYTGDRFEPAQDDPVAPGLRCLVDALGEAAPPFPTAAELTIRVDLVPLERP